jgi:beta-lactam-binding protein with PASTA domain
MTAPVPGTVFSGQTNGSTLSVAGFNSAAGENYAFIAICSENYMGSGPIGVASVSGLTLNWSKYLGHGNPTKLNPNAYVNTEIWYAPISSPVTAETTAIVFTTAIDNAVAIGFCASGVSSSIFDTPGGMPAIADSTGSGTLETTGVNTINADDLVIFVTTTGNSTTDAPPSGYTHINSLGNSAGAYSCYGYMSGIQLSSALSGATVASAISTMFTSSAISFAIAGSIVPTVPDVNGQVLAAGEATLTSAGYVVGTVTNVTSNTTVAGSIDATVPAAGASYATGGTVNINVSIGPPIDEYFPNVGYVTLCDTSGGAAGVANSDGIFQDQSNFLIDVGTSEGYLNTTNQNFGKGCIDLAAPPGSTSAGGLVQIAIATLGPIDLSAGDYTVEGWFNERGTGASILFGTTYGSGALLLLPTGGVCAPVVDGSTLPSGTYSLNAWHHHAIVRASNMATYYIDGVATGAAVAVTPVSWAGETFYIGGSQFGAAYAGLCNGFRITKGIARYVTNFTPAAQVFPGPAAPGIDADFASVGILLTMNGRAGTTIFSDVSGNSLPVSVASVTTSQTAPLNFGPAAAAFNGSSANLQVPVAGSGPLDIGIGDSTIEGWIYASSSQGGGQGVVLSIGDGTHTPFEITYNSGSQILVCAGRGSTAINSGSVPAETWAHFALVVDGTVVTIYINGIAAAPGTAPTGSSLTSGYVLCIGDTLPSPPHTPFGGSLADIRITKGLARYTANFTPPTVPFGGSGPDTAGDAHWSNVSLLLDCSILSPRDLSPVENILTVTQNSGAGDTFSAVDFQNPIFLNNGSFSSFTGAGAYLSTPISPGSPLDLSAGDFTIDGWFCAFAPDTTAAFLQMGTSSVSGLLITVGNSSDISAIVYGGSSVAVNSAAAYPSPVEGTWVHFAIVSASGMLGAFVNGQAGSAVAAPSTGAGWDLPLKVNQGVVGSVNGLRITKGVARYTPGTSFAVPTLPPAIGAPSATMVPNIVGLSQAAAESLLITDGYTVGTVTTAYSGSVPAGDVISQNPAAGTPEAPGYAVDFVVSLGVMPPLEVVPNVVGLSQALATSTIIAASLTLGTVTTASSGSVPSGDVISQSPIAGTSEVSGSPVAIVVSTGAVTTVPNLFNVSRAVADALLAAAGLVEGTVTTGYNVLIIAGNVTAQSPASGTTVAVGSGVNFELSLGRESLTVPDLFGLTESDAQTLLLSLGLVPGAVGFAPSMTGESGLVMSQNPAAGNPINSGGVVSFVISTGLPPKSGVKFDFEATVISQYANSPTLLQIVSNMNDYVDQSTNFANFFNFVWNVDTAQGFGLDIWGKIVGVSRLLHIPTTFDYVGFDNSATPPPDWQTMGSDQPPQPAVGGAMYTGDNATQTYLLSDDAYRQLILAKAFANICSTTAPAINQILQNLYGAGNAWVLNAGPMAITYNLNFTPTAIQLAILEQSGIIPTPPGVAATVVIV